MHVIFDQWAFPAIGSYMNINEMCDVIPEARAFEPISGLEFSRQNLIIQSKQTKLNKKKVTDLDLLECEFDKG